MAVQVKSILQAAALAGFATAGLSGAAQAQGSRVGILECNVSGGTGFVITSSKALDCFFRPDANLPPERYLGTINRFGLDIGFTGPGKFAWGVLTASAYPGPGSLAGVYTGVGGGATLGAGANANILVGGNNQSLSLQPLSVSGQIGLNVTAGVGEIVLDYFPPAPPPERAPRR